MAQRLAEPEDYEDVRSRVITGLPLDVRSVEARDGRMHFAMAGAVRRRVPERSLLGTFLSLRDASDRKMLQFAARWGSLELCEHGYPPAPAPALCPVRCQEPWLVRSRRWEHVANPEHWRAWAKRFQALAALSQGVGEEWEREIAMIAFEWWPRVASDIDVLTLPQHPGRGVSRKSAPFVPGAPEPVSLPEPSTETMRRAAIIRTLNVLIRASGIRSEVVMIRGGGWALIDGSHNLFGALVAQLVQECVNVRSRKMCRECRQGFKADRRTAIYCPKCRDAGVPLRRAEQARRDRLRAKGLTSRGTKYQTARHRAKPPPK